MVLFPLKWRFFFRGSHRFEAEAVGQHAEVAKHACNYNRVAAFGLFFLFQHTTFGQQKIPVYQGVGGGCFWWPLFFCWFVCLFCFVLFVCFVLFCLFCFVLVCLFVCLGCPPFCIFCSVYPFCQFGLQLFWGVIYRNTLSYMRNKNMPNAAAWISGVTSWGSQWTHGEEPLRWVWNENNEDATSTTPTVDGRNPASADM